MNNILKIGVGALAMVSMMTQAQTGSQNETVTQIPSMQNPIKITTRSPIVGLWGMEIPNNKKCTEYYNFKANNEVYVRSGQEWSTGRYDYQLPNERSDALSGLILQINFDNNEVDCSGQKIDQSGEISQYFVKWNHNNQIEFCASAQQEHCFARLNRVLP